MTALPVIPAKAGIQRESHSARRRLRRTPAFAGVTTWERSMNEYAKLRVLLSEAGYAFIEPPVVHPASVFVELAGEELRRRLYLTSAEDGEELALRPDYTIPVCLHHLATGAAKRKANYAYLGPVFRMRPGESGEFSAGGRRVARADGSRRRRCRCAQAGVHRCRPARRQAREGADRRLGVVRLAA